MKRIKKIISVVLAVTLIFTSVNPADIQAKQQSIRLKKTKEALVIGEKTQITVLNAGSKAKLSFKNNNKNIVSVSKKEK